MHCFGTFVGFRLTPSPYALISVSFGDKQFSLLKILIVKLSSIGDIVHALPALANINRELPDAEVGWAVDGRYAEILRNNPLIDHLIEIDTKCLRGGKVTKAA